MTPLVSIVTNLSAGSEAEKEYQNMIRLLLLHQRIDVNICEKGNDNTALHLAMCFQQREALQLLLSHPDIKTYLVNKEQQNPNGCAKQNRAEYLITELQKARKGKELLDALSIGNIYQAKRLLNQELNPNCWKRTQDGRIKTPLSLIIKSCLQGITQENEEVLTKLLKHKDLDFSQIKPIRAIEQNSRLKKIIEQAITERLTDAINRKDLGDVKELVEDNCFINRAIVTAAFESIERIRNYLNEKFPTSAEQPVANTNNIPAGFEEFAQKLVDELEKIKAQLAETEQKLDKVVREKTSETSKISQLERDLKQVREERDRLSSENRRLRTKSLSNKNEKSSQAISPGKKQSNYAYAFFILSGALTGCVGLAILYDYLVIGACLTAVALVLFLVGYYLCKADERDIGPGGTTDNPQVTRVLISSPGPAENFCTC